MPHSRLIRFWAGNATEVSDGVFRCQIQDASLQNITGVSLKTAQFSNNVYNIQEGKNDGVSFKIDVGATQQVLLSPGYYSAGQIASTLVSLIQPVLDGASPGSTIAISLNPITQRLESTATGVAWSWEVDTANAYIGLDPNNPSPTLADGTLYQFPFFANLYGLESVTISVQSQDPKTLLNTGPSAYLATNSIGVVPVNVPFGALVAYEQFSLHDAIVDFRGYQNMTSLQISIRDVNGNGVPNQGNHLLVEIMVYFPDRREG